MRQKLQSTAESLCRKIGAFDHLVDFVGHSYTASEFEELPALQQTLALQRMALFTRYDGYNFCSSVFHIFIHLSD